MRAVTRDELRTNLQSLLIVQKPWVKNTLEIRQEAAMKRMIEEILVRVLGSPENEHVLLVPSRVIRQAGEREGRWGQDEPHPSDLLPISIRS